MPTHNAGWVTAAIVVALAAVLVLRPAADLPPPHASTDSPGVLAADGVAARQQLAAARQTADVLAQRQAAATANAVATDRARAAGATATEQAWNLTLRQAQATETAHAHRATATADALALSATTDAQHAQATAQARDAQATADTRALDQARAIAATTADAHALALASMQAEASTQVAIERERTLSSTLTALCGMSALMLFVAATAAAYIVSQYASARWHTLSTRPVAGGTLVLIGNTTTGFATRLVPETTRRRAAKPAIAPPADIVDLVPDIPLIEAEPVLTPLLRPAPHSPDRQLAVRLLRHSIGQRGDGGTRLATWREIDWPSEQWQRARQSLDGYLRIKPGRGGGTYLVEHPYPTLGELLGAVLAGEASLGPSPAERMAVN